MIKKPELNFMHSHYYLQVFASDKLLVFIYGLKFGQWGKKAQRKMTAYAEVNQKKRPFTQINLCVPGVSVQEKVINTFSETSASFLCSTRSKGFAEPVGDLQITTVLFKISPFTGGSDIQTKSMSTWGSLTTGKRKQPFIVPYALYSEMAFKNS